MNMTIKIMGGFALLITCCSVNAQQSWEAQKNPTVDSITAKYKDRFLTVPAASNIPELIFPVIGRYESVTNPEIPVLTVSPDENNKGVIWIEGLASGKVKGLLMRSPATYKIPVQKTAEGAAVKEGTLIYDKEQNTLSICLGKNYNPENPSVVFEEANPEQVNSIAVKVSKTSKEPVQKPWIYTGTKVALSTAGN